MSQRALARWALSAFLGAHLVASSGCKTQPTSATAKADATGQSAAAGDSAAPLPSSGPEDDALGGGTIDTSGASPAPSASSTAQPREDLPGLTNFAKVSDALYRGAQPTAEGFQTLKKMGIKTVINLRALHSDRHLLEGTGLQYLHIPAKAWHPEAEDILKALRVIRDPKNQPVFVHCQHGADRTGVTIASYRIIEQGWKPADAANELPAFHFHPVWHQITDFLAAFDRDRLKSELDAMAPVTLETVN